MKSSLIFIGIYMLGFGFIVEESKAYSLRLFEDENFKGARYTVEGNLNQCIDLNSQWDNDASSVYPDQEACAVVFTEKGCEGDSFLVERPIKRLAKQELNDAVSSIRLQTCPDLAKFWEE